MFINLITSDGINSTLLEDSLDVESLQYSNCSLKTQGIILTKKIQKKILKKIYIQKKKEKKGKKDMMPWMIVKKVALEDFQSFEERFHHSISQ